MLQTQSVEKSLWNFIKDLQGKEILRDYFLVGGTALSLQIGHRISHDIDLFTRDDINKDDILSLLNKDYNGKYQLHNIQKMILQISINDIKIDFVKYNYNLIEDIKSEEEIRLLGIKDISAMKLMAIANRDEQAKDFIYVFYLLKEMELKDMFEYYKLKFRQSDINPIKRSLVYFDDVTESNWLSVRLLKDDFSIDNVKQTLIEKMNEYNKKSLRKYYG